MSQKGKAFMIEAYASDNSLLNKYKFVLLAKTVNELREKIIQKMVAKNQLKKQDKLTIKDTNDFELGSDDEVDDVLPDCKLRVYVSEQKNISSVNVPVQLPVQTVQPPQQTTTATTVIPKQQLAKTVSNTNLGSNVAVNVPIINTSNWTEPNLPENFPKDKTLTIICPQIRKTEFKIEAMQNLTFLELSNYIVKSFGLPQNLKALLYTKQGQPLLFNLDLVHQLVPKFNNSNIYYVIFTATMSPSADIPIVEPKQIMANQTNIFVMQKQNKITFQIDLNNSLSVLKYRIFKKMGIPPLNQIIKFANNPLINDNELLSIYNIKQNSILTLEFKVISNLIPFRYADKFYYKDVQLLHPQDQQAYRFFKSNLLAFAYHLQDQDKNKILCYLRLTTGNQPFVTALRTLWIGGALLSQAHRIALEQGFYSSIWEHMKSSTPQPHTEVQFVFNHTRHFLGFLLKAIENTKNMKADFDNVEQATLLGRVCSLTMKNIQVPGLIKLNNGSIAVVDKLELIEQINKGYNFPLLQKPKAEEIYETESLLQNWEILLFNSQESVQNISICLWFGADKKNLDFDKTASSEVQKYESLVETKYPNLKIHQPLQIKNKTSDYLIVLNKQSECRIFVGRNKDINKPHNIFDVITGKEEAVNLDLLMAAGKTENLEEVVDLSKLKPVITRQPKQAIVVLFDISGSMSGQFFNEKDLKRIGACKSFFEALAYRTIAYSFQHVISLVFFDGNVHVQCDFTEAIYDFNRLVSAAAPTGSTALYDAIIKGTQNLVQFKKRYPQCILRILAMTDGEDVSSQKTIKDACREVLNNNIILDSFAVGTNCEGLKIISNVTGGKCYLTRNMEESLKLFEQETVLSVRARNQQQRVKITTDHEIDLAIEKAKLVPFNMGNSVHEFKRPQIKNALTTKQIITQYTSQEGQKKISGNNSLKRITKQIQNYNDNPHPFVAIFPCENINIWKILLLGPKETPYQNGLFLLYVNFPGDYPFRAPQIRFITPIYHCNMNQQGRICHSVFDRNYSPAITFRHIVDCIYGLILTPEPEDPLDNVVASFFLSDYPQYLKNARESTDKNSSKSSLELVEDIYGKITEDSERQEKREEIEKWIQKAKSFN